MAELEKNMEYLRQGNKEALKEVYLLTKNTVFFTALSILGDMGFAEDIMHDTYIKLCENIHLYKKGTNAKAWISSIAKNLSINKYNRKKFEEVTDFGDKEYLSPQLGIKAKDESGIFKLMREKLNENEYKIIMLHVLAGMKFREIAIITEKSQGTVRWQYNNAIKKIKASLNKEVL